MNDAEKSPIIVIMAIALTWEWENYEKGKCAKKEIAMKLRRTEYIKILKIKLTNFFLILGIRHPEVPPPLTAYNHTSLERTVSLIWST